MQLFVPDDIPTVIMPQSSSIVFSLLIRSCEQRAWQEMLVPNHKLLPLVAVPLLCRVAAKPSLQGSAPEHLGSVMPSWHLEDQSSTGPVNELVTRAHFSRSLLCPCPSPLTKQMFFEAALEGPQIEAVLDQGQVEAVLD